MPRRIPYDQFCPIARTLDLVGDRWMLPVVRELHLGPLRYTDLQRTLPGIGTDVLADRLRRLANQGLITHEPDGRYRITAEGRALGPLLREMLRWGGSHLDPAERPARPDPRLAVESIVLNAEPDPSRHPTTVELRVDDLVCHAVMDSEAVIAEMGRAEAPDAIVETDAATLYAIALGTVEIAAAVAAGMLAIAGNRHSVEVLLVEVGLPTSMRRRPSG